mmetsp:Transcript_11042/g.31010  ORF Transcript_11042/g.31010 Transcript_11042/m.31010 type:complete len:292 (-) Transcript_11042:347-1222(-)
MSSLSSSSTANTRTSAPRSPGPRSKAPLAPKPKKKADYYTKGSMEVATETALTIAKLEKRRKLTRNSERVVIVLVGLPGRGKSFVARKLQTFLNWRGTECKVFNVGKYRREANAGAAAAAAADAARVAAAARLAVEAAVARFVDCCVGVPMVGQRSLDLFGGGGVAAAADRRVPGLVVRADDARGAAGGGVTDVRGWLLRICRLPKPPPFRSVSAICTCRANHSSSSALLPRPGMVGPPLPSKGTYPGDRRPLPPLPPLSLAREARWRGPKLLLLRDEDDVCGCSDVGAIS